MFDSLRRLFPGSNPPDRPETTEDLLQRWQKLPLGHSTVDVFQPATDQRPAGVVLFLHGHGEISLTGNRVFTSLLQQPTRPAATLRQR